MNEQSFTALLVPLSRPAYRLAAAMLHDAAAAEDVVQDASLIAWTKLSKLKDQTQLRPWFFRIVANECRNARRKRWFSLVTFGLPPHAATLSGEERWVTRADVRRALARLSHEDRLVVSLYFYVDMPVPEIAAVIDSTVDATRRRLYRAIHRLRPELEIEEALR